MDSAGQSGLWHCGTVHGIITFITGSTGFPSLKCQENVSWTSIFVQSASIKPSQSDPIQVILYLIYLRFEGLTLLH